MLSCDDDDHHHHRDDDDDGDNDFNSLLINHYGLQNNPVQNKSFH